jgi:prepilin-type N-terminal cleavage/methylation domain-containing protein/prepilin-type processing-associated H-X9-DG protein
VPFSRAGFTLIEVLVVVAIIALLIAILLPTLSKAREQARRVNCGSNLVQFQLANFYYLGTFKGFFPPHRYPSASGEPFWFQLLGRYAKGQELARCPSTGLEQDRNTWSWRYDAANLGYGYNAFFLGHYSQPNGERWGTYIAAENWWRESRVKRPSDTILFGDSNPKPDGLWSSTLWWPFINSDGEGLNGSRHSRTGRFVYTIQNRQRGDGNVAFNDGHVEYRLVRTTNPEKDNTDEFIRFWDPLQRQKP